MRNAKGGERRGAQALFSASSVLRAGEGKPEGKSLAASAESRATHDVAHARRLLDEGLAELGLGKEDLKSLPGSDARKVIIAQAMHELTSVSQAWIAEHLEMRSAANVSQQLRRLKRGEIKAGKVASQWLSRSVS